MAKKVPLFKNTDDIINLNTPHSKEGVYDNWKDATEDVYIFINAQTEALIKLSNHLNTVSDNLEEVISFCRGLDNVIDRRLNSFSGDIDTIKRDVSVIQSRIKGLNELGTK